VPTAHQVRAKSRLAVRRREDDVEQEEIEGGEINLIPYLDIVTNLMLFLLASVSANIVFGHINTTLPDQGAPPPSQANDPGKKPDEQLALTVAVTKDEIRLFSISGLEGTNQDPKLRVPRIGRPGDKCDGDYLCETNRCVDQRCAYLQRCDGKPALCDTTRCVSSQCVPAADIDLTPVYDYRALNAALVEIATRRYAGKIRKPETYQALLMADPSIPYGTLISVISAMRCPMAKFGEPSHMCFLPTADEKLKKADNPVDAAAHLYDTDRTPYDPKQHALFPDVVFSGGFR